MPEEGVELAPKAHILSDDEVVRLAEMFVKQGVTKIRLTGGEPTIRKGMVELVGKYYPPPPTLNAPNSNLSQAD
jgi:molybdenum cofactor biosynthesis enzyme MoaA